MCFDTGDFLNQYASSYMNSRFASERLIAQIKYDNPHNKLHGDFNVAIPRTRKDLVFAVNLFEIYREQNETYTLVLDTETFGENIHKDVLPRL